MLLASEKVKILKEIRDAFETHNGAYDLINRPIEHYYEALSWCVDELLDSRRNVMLGTEWVDTGKGMTLKEVIKILKKRKRRPVLLDQQSTLTNSLHKEIIEKKTNLAFTGFALRSDDYDRMEMVKY